MSRYLPYRVVGGTCAVAICARCSMKMYYGDLSPDPDAPGLRVCKDCADLPDPYRKPARKTENISLKYPRPDEELE